MTIVDDFWQIAHNLYVRVRSSADPVAKRIPMRAADDYQKQANDIHRSEVIKAEFPKVEFYKRERKLD